MTTTPQTGTGTGAGGTKAVALQLSELVLRTALYGGMAAFCTHVLGHGPFYERTPDPDAPPSPADMPERAVDVRLGFFHIADAPHSQVFALFGVESPSETEPSGPGLHHFQFGVSSLGDLISQHEHMASIGVRPHRAANHGQATSFYYRDPDRNIVEFSCPNFATTEEEVAFMSGPVFAANPSGLELDPDRFAVHYRAGDSDRELLRLDNQAVAL
ncbi:VOC family protein (plasmid) [Streptomyces sp. NBC_01340]|uniref:VOC family protein n=1 Tax=unclassified Streptomyces TaxID=2593676 RepID=UPI002257C20F|nr:MULTISPECIES: VOC family protein [unclassified Streptomyces]MCX4461699.1 VOC family protein [Streptomyces sp. NBC_01719]MCX4490608.1 VOC family protein [Streptomyces sp. NBC_01728]WSI45633.1 VOC family protein [Streptomyces sp. NBC_01340]